MATLRIQDEDRGGWVVLDDDRAAKAEKRARVAILASGAPPAEARLRAEVARTGTLACTGGGLRAAWAVGLVPSLVVGDPEEVPAWAREKLPPDAVVADRGQDASDLEKTLAEVYRRFGDKAEVSLLAASWGAARTDHTLAHLGVLLAEPHRRVQWVDEDGRLVALRRGSLEIEDAVGATLSILPWSLHGAVVSGVGVHYPLDERRLQLGGQGIENQIGDDLATVEVHEGVALLWIGL